MRKPWRKNRDERDGGGSNKNDGDSRVKPPVSCGESRTELAKQAEELQRQQQKVKHGDEATADVLHQLGLQKEKNSVKPAAGSHYLEERGIQQAWLAPTAFLPVHPSLLATKVGVRVQGPHYDFLRKVMVHRPEAMNSRMNAPVRSDNKHWLIGFFPLCKYGMFLQFWPNDKSGRLLSEGTIVFIPFGTLFVVPCDTLHAGGFRFAISDHEINKRGHIFIYPGEPAVVVDNPSSQWGHDIHPDTGEPLTEEIPFYVDHRNNHNLYGDGHGNSDLPPQKCLGKTLFG